MMVGERLRAIREYKRMSQGDVERRTGLLRCYLSRCENGHTVPTVETLEKWARALGVSMAQLFVGDGESAPRDMLPPRPKGRATGFGPAEQRELRKIVETVAKVKPRDRRLLLLFARKLAARS